MRIRLLLAGAVIGPLGAADHGGASAAAPPASRPAATRPAAGGPPTKDWGLPLLMSVRLERPEAKAGRDARFTLEFRNESDRPIVVMMPIEGTEDGLRKASYSWSFTYVDGRSVPYGWTLICGNTAGIRAADADDFITVPPRGKARVDQILQMRPPPVPPEERVGEFRATLVYAFHPSRREGGKRGKDTVEAEALMKRAWVGTVVSDPVTFRIVP
ncbi:MAG: hypothetical protein JWO31_1549 [Phycisphaerales bacterium]|nr:hypothetical protein [Phycisphaerales bacterium]